MIPSGTFIRIVSGFYLGGKAVKTRYYNPMTSIPVPGQTGNIIPLEVIPASDGSGTYVLVVALQDAEIDVGTVNIALTYNLDPPVLIGDAGQARALLGWQPARSDLELQISDAWSWMTRRN